MRSDESPPENEDVNDLADEEYVDPDLSAEEVAKWREEEEKWQAEDRIQNEVIERELTEKYGPPEVREQKRKRYIACLLLQYSEPFIRRLLVELRETETALAKSYLPRHLERVDLKNTPLHAIIRPYSFFAYHLEFEELGDDVLRVRGGRASGHCGSGSRIDIQRVGENGFLVLERSMWCA